MSGGIPPTPSEHLAVILCVVCMLAAIAYVLFEVIE